MFTKENQKDAGEHKSPISNPAHFLEDLLVFWWAARPPASLLPFLSWSHVAQTNLYFTLTLQKMTLNL